MGLFMRNFDKPGPGVSPDAPRKKGAARFFEILGRDFSTIWLAGILAMLGGLPFAAGVWFAVETHSLVPLVIAGVLGGMIAAPQIVGLKTRSCARCATNPATGGRPTAAPGSAT